MEGRGAGGQGLGLIFRDPGQMGRGARRKVGFLLGPGAGAQAQGGDKEGVGLVCMALGGGIFSDLACTKLPNSPAPNSQLACPPPSSPCSVCRPVSSICTGTYPTCPGRILCLHEHGWATCWSLGKLGQARFHVSFG